MSEQSFSATGPTVVAFETLSTSTPVDQSFGASVVGSVCGVYGQGIGEHDAQRERTKAPTGTGVFGRGISHGVYGITWAVSEEDTPTFDYGYPGTSVGVGVVGVSGGTYVRDDAPAVFGDNYVLGRQTGRISSIIDQAIHLPVGVEGMSWHGFGVCGISLNFDPEKPRGPKIDWDVAGVKAIAGDSSTKPAGVLGLGNEGAGVRGVSRSDRGGIFQSAMARQPEEPLVAQIRLDPPQVDLPPGATHPALPRNGQPGDLLAVSYLDPNFHVNTDLWFCARGETRLGPAVWNKVAFTESVLGT
jgi:hypothetical protein